MAIFNSYVKLPEGIYFRQITCRSFRSWGRELRAALRAGSLLMNSPGKWLHAFIFTPKKKQYCGRKKKTKFWMASDPTKPPGPNRYIDNLTHPCYRIGLTWLGLRPSFLPIYLQKFVGFILPWIYPDCCSYSRDHIAVTICNVPIISPYLSQQNTDLHKAIKNPSPSYFQNMSIKYHQILTYVHTSTFNYSYSYDFSLC